MNFKPLLILPMATCLGFLICACSQPDNSVDFTDAKSELANNTNIGDGATKDEGWEQYFADVEPFSIEELNQRKLQNDQLLTLGDSVASSERKMFRFCGVSPHRNGGFYAECEGEQPEICKAITENIRLYGGAYDARFAIAPLHPDNPYKVQEGAELVWETLDPEEYGRLIRDFTLDLASVGGNSLREGQWQNISREYRQRLFDNELNLQRLSFSTNQEIDAELRGIVPLFRLGPPKTYTIAESGKTASHSLSLDGEITEFPVYFLDSVHAESIARKDGPVPTKINSSVLKGTLVFNGRIFTQSDVWISEIRPDRFQSDGLFPWPACTVDGSSR